MTKKFEFQEKGHKYTLDGKPLTGVTTILGVIAKPALIQWSANMAVEYVKEKAKWNDPFLTQDEYEKVLQEAKTAHRRKRDDAGKKGTDVHKEIESWIKMLIVNGGGYAGYDPDFKIVSKQAKHFMDWAVKNKVKFFESEKKMYSEKHWIAGTCDFTCEIDGKKYVGDIKTSSGIYGREPMAQCAGYRMILEEMGQKDFVGSVIVNIKKTGVFDEEKDVYCSLDYKEDLRLFMGALEVYRVINNTKFTK